jgi:HTH-type transcriptional regulator / antitoxin HigA
MKPKLVKNEADYKTTLARIEEIFNAKLGSPEGDELDLLVTLVELYEEKTYRINLPDPITAIRFRMEQQGLKAKDMVPYIGSAPKVSEVLSGKRRLSLTMIRNLVSGLDIPAEVLLQELGAKLLPNPALKQGRYRQAARDVLHQRKLIHAN